jgi:hypothetical protein
MANDIIDINVYETTETVDITVNPNLTTVNINQVTGSGGDTNLGYTPSPTNGIVTSDTGTDATIPLADDTNAGLLTAAEKTKIANSVPYTGALSDVNLGEFGIQLGNLEFDNTPTNIPTTAGSMYYNDTDGTLDLILKGGNVTLQIGQEQVVRVVNKTATNITLLEANYQAVRITGAQGQRMKVDLAQATNDVLSSETIGLVTETIANNAEGFVTTSGLVRGINTTGSLQSETWLDGDILYLSPTVAGQITKVKPTAPNHLIIIGYVISAHITQGTIFVKVDNGYELDELHNVKIDTATNNEVLAYTSATDIWENKTLSEAGIQPTITLTTTGTSGASTLVGATLNIPQYSGGISTQAAYTVLANNTNASAVPTEQVFKDITEQSLSNTSIVWTGTTAPSGTSNHTYRWSQIGKLVTLRVNLVYTVAGNALTMVSIPFDNMSDLPVPATVTGFIANGETFCLGAGLITTAKTAPSFTNIGVGASAIRRNTTGTGTVPYDLLIIRNTINAIVGTAYIQYYTT